MNYLFIIYASFVSLVIASVNHDLLAYVLNNLTI
jgi:hypothetical protein